MSNIAAKWNLLDTIIYKVETTMIKLSNAIKENRDELPDPEEMIAVATEQLQAENKLLKKKEYPGIIKYENGHYYCPDCNELISGDMITRKKKYCPECGKRIVMSVPYYEKHTMPYTEDKWG